jgi:hypothetical protein
MEPNVPARERMCRRLIPRQISWKELFPRITIVNDPKKLAELRAELQRRKAGLSITDGKQ